MTATPTQTAPTFTCPSWCYQHSADPDGRIIHASIPVGTTRPLVRAEIVAPGPVESEIEKRRRAVVVALRTGSIRLRRHEAMALARSLERAAGLLGD